MSKQFIRDLKLKWKWSKLRKRAINKNSEDIYTSEHQKRAFHLAERLIKNPKSKLYRDGLNDTYYVECKNLILKFSNSHLEINTPNSTYATLIGSKLYSKVYDFYHDRNTKNTSSLEDTIVVMNMGLVDSMFSELKKPTTNLVHEEVES